MGPVLIVHNLPLPAPPAAARLPSTLLQPLPSALSQQIPAGKGSGFISILRRNYLVCTLYHSGQNVF